MASNPGSFTHRIMPTAHRILVEKLVASELPLVRGRTLVVGAGHDPYRKYLSSSTSIISSDIADDSNCLDIIADTHDLPFPDASFDAVVAIEVIEHLHNPRKAVEEWRRILTPGGVVVASVPFMFRVHGDPMDYTRFTRNGLNVLFDCLTVSSIREIGGRVHVISDLVTTASKALVPLRIGNHLLCALSRKGSQDSPSGYWITANNI